MTYQATVDWLFQQVPNYQHQGGAAYKPGLNRINELLAAIQDPHKKIKTIHIAGTNGKGSVSHILAAIFQKHGYRTGLFTSPHIKDFRERIKINGALVDKDFVTDFCTDNKSVFQEVGVSFFEITTAMAFAAFENYKCDIAIIETGLGGRLDSTNVITPELSIITNIGIDHAAFLGNTLNAIAGEKAGIIKKDIPVVIGDTDESLRALFKQKAKETNSTITFSQDNSFEPYKTDLLGRFQQRNIHTCITAISLLEKAWSLDKEIALKALEDIQKRTNFLGRLQQIGQSPTIIMDAAHNKAGMISLIKEVQNFSFKHLRIVYGASNDKDWQEIIKNFPSTAICYLVEFGTSRSVKASEFEIFCKKEKNNFKIFKKVSEGLSVCKTESSEGDLILICGSFYVMEKII